MSRGSIFKKSNGMYAYRLDIGSDPSTGGRRQLQKSGFRTKKEAQNSLNEKLQSVRSGQGVNNSSITLGGFLDQWIVTQTGRLKQTTYSSYIVATKRIIRFLGQRKLAALTPLEIEQFYADLAISGSQAGKPLSAKSIRNTHVVLRKALGDAQRLGITQRNPASSAKPPVVRRKEFQTWDSQEVRAFLDDLSGDRFYAIYVLFATTGMRRAEALGIRWCDIDLDSQELAVVHTITTVASQPVVSPPKTNYSRRVICLDEWTTTELRLHRDRQLEERQAAGLDWCNDIDLVFRDEFGRMINPDWFSDEFARRVRASSLPKIRLHDLRHTYATLALKAGIHPKIVSERLGHSSVAITLDLYSHVTPALARDAAEVVAREITSQPD